MRLIYHPEAEAELIEAARFYEQRVPGLGARFLDATDHAIKAILEDPESFRIFAGNIRQSIMSKFPYTIYFRIHPDHLRILAFKHHSRHPDYWRDRIED